MAFLLLVGTLHFFYEQYISRYMLLFVLCLPVLSLAMSLPAMLTTHVSLSGEREVEKGRSASLTLEANCRFWLPLYCFSVRMTRENLFTGEKLSTEKLCLYGVQNSRRSIGVPTERCGVIRCALNRGWAWDYLGIIALPIKTAGDAFITVLPRSEEPVPVPQLTEDSAITLKPKPGGLPK